MKKNAAFALSALLIGMGSVAATAQADELVSANVSVQLINRQSVSVADLIATDLGDASLRTLMIVASSNDQRDNPSGPNGTALDIFVNGRLFASDALRSHLGMFQIALRGIQDASAIELRARSVSGVKIAMVGLTVDGGYIPQPNPPNPPTNYGMSADFQGRFGEVDVIFTGRTIADLNQDCQTYMGTASTTSVNSIQVGSIKSSKTYGYWNKDQLCAIATLNARIASQYRDPAPVLASGKMGEVPFSIQAESIEEAASRVSTYAPVAAGQSMNSIEINGVKSSKTYGYWSASEMANLLKFNLVLPGNTNLVKGLIGEAPYSFNGYSTTGVREQCRSYMANMPSAASVNRVQVNGKVNSKQYGYWNGEEVCMMIAAGVVGGGVMQPMPPR